PSSMWRRPPWLPARTCSRARVRGEALVRPEGAGLAGRCETAAARRHRRRCRPPSALPTRRAVGPARRECARRRGWDVKRTLDVGLSLVGLIVLAPLLLVLAVLLKLDSPGPAFYRGVRVGAPGRACWFFNLQNR